MKYWLAILYSIVWLLWVQPVGAAPVNAHLTVVAAEATYGRIAAQIGGPFVQVTTILSRPEQDPHLFSSNVALAKQLAQADLVIYNGLNYDAWMPKLLAANRSSSPAVIVVADLTQQALGANPHIWYAVSTMNAYVVRLTAELSRLLPQQQLYFQTQAQAFQQSLQRLNQQIIYFRERYQGVAIIATEPVFDYMARALGLTMEGQAFQLSTMNGTEPSAAAIREFEAQLRQHRVQALIYNNQVSSPQTERMKQLAQQQKIPVVGVSELQPVNLDYVEWMQQQLIALQQAFDRDRRK